MLKIQVFKDLALHMSVTDSPSQKNIPIIVLSFQKILAGILFIDKLEFSKNYFVSIWSFFTKVILAVILIMAVSNLTSEYKIFYWDDANMGMFTAGCGLLKFQRLVLQNE